MNLLLLQSIYNQLPPPGVSCKGLFGTSEGHVASLRSEAVTSHTAIFPLTLCNASLRSLAQIISSGTTSLLAFPLMKVPLNQLAVTVSKPGSLGRAMPLLGSAERDYRDDMWITGRQKMLSQQLEAWSLPCSLGPVRVERGNSLCHLVSSIRSPAVGKVRKITRNGAAQGFPLLGLSTSFTNSS